VAKYSAASAAVAGGDTVTERAARQDDLESILVEEERAPTRAAPAAPPREPAPQPAAPRPAAPQPASDTQAGEEEFQYPFEDTIAGETGINLDQSDPLAEADFHMAYGLYDQAAEIVKKAIEREPDRYDLRRKLIDICFVWGNAEEFLAQAKAIKSMNGESEEGDWGKVAIMGKQICPGEELFAAAEAAQVDYELGDVTQAPPQLGEAERPREQGLDFDVGESDEVLQALGDTREQRAVDLELPPQAERTAELDLEELGIDLDLGETGEHALKDLAERAPELTDETGQFEAGVELPELPGDEEESGTLMMDTSAMQRASESPTHRGEGWQENEDEPTVTGMTGYDEQDDESDHTAIKKALPLQEAPTAEVGGFEEDFDTHLDLDDLTQSLKEGRQESDAQPEDDAVTQLAPGIRPPEGYDDDTREIQPREPNEVGTKLDLARAYIDMGDPDGARSILEEVLEEGDDSQQAEARQLLDSLG
jgi:pilus assembly protein FimV